MRYPYWRIWARFDVAVAVVVVAVAAAAAAAAAVVVVVAAAAAAAAVDGDSVQMTEHLQETVEGSDYLEEELEPCRIYWSS